MLKFGSPKYGTDFQVVVRLNGKAVGKIRRNEKGYYYQPLNSKITGDIFLTLEECKESLR